MVPFVSPPRSQQKTKDKLKECGREETMMYDVEGGRGGGRRRKCVLLCFFDVISSVRRPH